MVQAEQQRPLCSKEQSVDVSWSLGLRKEKRGENSSRTLKSRVTLICCFQPNGCCHFEHKAWTSVSPQSQPLSGAIAGDH